MQKGFSAVMTVIVVGVVLIIMAVILSGGVIDSVGGIGQWGDDERDSSTRVDCQSKVDYYCGRPDQSDNADWGEKFPQCTQYRDVIDDNGNTIC